MRIEIEVEEDIGFRFSDVVAIVTELIEQRGVTVNTSVIEMVLLMGVEATEKLIEQTKNPGTSLNE